MKYIALITALFIGNCYAIENYLTISGTYYDYIILESNDNFMVLKKKAGEEKIEVTYNNDEHSIGAVRKAPCTKDKYANKDLNAKKVEFEFGPHTPNGVREVLIDAIEIFEKYNSGNNIKG